MSTSLVEILLEALIVATEKSSPCSSSEREPLLLSLLALGRVVVVLVVAVTIVVMVTDELSRRVVVAMNFVTNHMEQQDFCLKILNVRSSLLVQLSINWRRS